MKRGKVAERSKAAVLKTAESKGSAGSNPALSECETCDVLIYAMEILIDVTKKYCLQMDARDLAAVKVVASSVTNVIKAHTNPYLKEIKKLKARMK